MGVPILRVWDETRKKYVGIPAIKGEPGSGGSGFAYEIGDGLKVTDNVLSVDTADIPEEDNTKPITSAAVYSEIGNINVLLATI